MFTKNRKLPLTVITADKFTIYYNETQRYRTIAQNDKIVILPFQRTTKK